MGGAGRGVGEGDAGGQQEEIEQNVSEGEFSVNRYTTSGPGYVVTGMDMVRVRDGRVVEHLALMDVTARAAQLSPTPAGT